MTKRKLIIISSLTVFLVFLWIIKSLVFPGFHQSSLVRYQGRTELGPIDLFWDKELEFGTFSLNDGSRSWHVMAENSENKKVWQVHPSRLNDGNSAGILNWSNDITKVPTEGVWTVTPAADPAKIHLLSAYHYEEMSVSSGFLFRQRGLKKTVRLRIESMSDLYPWQDEFLSKMRLMIQVGAWPQFLKGGYKEAWRFFHQPTAANKWWQHLTFTKRFQNENLLSLQGVLEEFTGGAHGNLVYKPVNAYRTGRKQPVFRLEDLFDPASPAEQTLNELCMASLTLQGASELVQGNRTSLNFAEMYAFTFDESKLSIHFSPYAVASYAEGSFTVSIPSDKIIHLLSDRGAGKFLKAVWDE